MRTAVVTAVYLLCGALNGENYIHFHLKPQSPRQGESF